MSIVLDEVSKQKATFFQFAFGEAAEGYLCIARREVGQKDFHEEFFLYPKQLPELVDHIQRFHTSCDMWYCPQLFHGRKRRKDAAKTCPTAWSDLDTCGPELLMVKPSIVIESSPNRYQGLWRFTEPADPSVGESISKRIAYHHAEEGADKSGWDLTQLLRVPYTFNHKYGGVGLAPMVRVVSAEGLYYTPEDFAEYPEVQDEVIFDLPFPDELPTHSHITSKYGNTILPSTYMAMSAPPEADWSKQLWLLEMQLLEADLDVEEVFVLCQTAACNKYERDGRGDVALWNEVCRAYKHWTLKQQEFGPVIEATRPMLTAEEKTLQASKQTIVEEYVEWAKTLGDAAPQYHYAGIFTILSSLLSSQVRLQTSFGNVTLNLWFMILADSTVTRKTTAMDIAMDLLDEVDADAVLATDGSIEGMFSALSYRPGRASIFLRDEFSGLLDAMGKKEYMAGMSEMLTKMYDGKYQKRILKREVIEVRDPVLILFTGGIKNRIFEILTYDHVLSGFLPRFLFITATSDVTRIKPLGPPTVATDKKRAEILSKLETLYNHYNVKDEITVQGVTSLIPKKWQVELTPEAWQVYNDYEALMMRWAMDSQHRDIVLPTFDRMSKSGLKLAVLLACLRMPPDKVTVTPDDIRHAFYYIDQWRTYTVEVLTNIGKSAFERTLDSIVKMVYADPGVSRSALMQALHMSSRQATDMFNTIEERALLLSSSAGKGRRYYPPGGMPVEKADRENITKDTDGTET